MDSKKAYEMRKEELQWGDTLPKKEKTRGPLDLGTIGTVWTS